MGDSTTRKKVLRGAGLGAGALVLAVLALGGVFFAQGGGRVTYAVPVAFDSESACSATTANTVSWSTHDVGSGSNRLLLVGISFRRDSDTQTVSTVTWDSDGAGGALPVALTLVPGALQDNAIAGTTEDLRVEIWSLLNPATGTNGTIAIDRSGTATSPIACGAASFANVDQTTPLDSPSLASGDVGTTASVTVASAAGDTVFGVLGVEDEGGVTLGADQNSHWDVSTGGSGNANDIRGSGSSEPGAASVVNSWGSIGASDEWAMVGLNINEATSRRPPRPKRQHSRRRRRRGYAAGTC